MLSNEIKKMAKEFKIYPSTIAGAQMFIKDTLDDAQNAKTWAVEDPQNRDVFMVFVKYPKTNMGQGNNLPGWDVCVVYMNLKRKHPEYKFNEDFETVDDTKKAIEKYAPQEVKRLVESKKASQSSTLPVNAKDIKDVLHGSIAEYWDNYLVKGEDFDSGDVGDGHTYNLEFKFPLEVKAISRLMDWTVTQEEVDEFKVNKGKQESTISNITKKFKEDFKYYGGPGKPFSKGGCTIKVQEDGVLVSAWIQYGFDI